LVIAVVIIHTFHCLPCHRTVPTQANAPPKRKDPVFDIEKFIDKRVRVRFQGGREGEAAQTARISVAPLH
jgi:hypothetical protein